MPEALAFPPGWGNDTLSDFQSIAIQNEFATFTGAAPWYSALSAVTTDLGKCSEYAISIVTKIDDPTAPLLFMTAHNLFLASARLVTSGHCLPVHPTGRAGVESALYGWYTALHPGAGKRLHDKPTEGEALRTWNKEFKFSALAKALAKSSPETSEWAKYLHQTAIDLGAHPNKGGLYSDMLHEDLGSGRQLLQMSFLNKWNNNSIAATKFVLETGIFSLELFARAFAEAEKIHGIFALSSNHKMTLEALIEQYSQFVDDNLKRSNNVS